MKDFLDGTHSVDINGEHSLKMMYPAKGSQPADERPYKTPGLEAGTKYSDGQLFICVLSGGSGIFMPSDSIHLSSAPGTVVAVIASDTVQVAM